jgi:hypothetical protein
MQLTPEQNTAIEDFRTWIEKAVGELAMLGEFDRQDRDDRSTLATRWAWERDIWFEVALRPFLPQIRVGLLTTDRWKSEDFEQMIEDSGDTMQEFVELGFDTVGLDWRDPPVEHYRHEARYYYFATPLDLQSLDQLARDDIRAKVCKMVQGYHCAFSGTVMG